MITQGARKNKSKPLTERPAVELQRPSRKRKSKRLGCEIAEIFASKKRKQPVNEENARLGNPSKPNAISNSHEKTTRGKGGNCKSAVARSGKRTLDGLAICTEDDMGIGKADAGDASTYTVSVCLHYGGRTIHSPKAVYVGDERVKYDYVDFDRLRFDTLDEMSRNAGVRRQARYYMISDGQFKMLIDDKDIQEIALKHLRDNRQIDIYVDALECNEDVNEPEMDNGDTHCGINNNENEVEIHKIEDGGRYVEQGIVEMGELMDCVGCSDYVVDEHHDDTEDDVFFETSVDSAVSSDVLRIERDLERGRVSDEERGLSYPIFNRVDLYDPEFVVGMVFASKHEFKKAVESYAIKTSRSISFKKNDKIRVYAKCATQGCKWMIHALKVPDEITFRVAKFWNVHSENCYETFDVKNVTSKWLSEKYLRKFKTDPKRSIAGFRRDVINDIKCNVSLHQAYRTKWRALKMLESDAAYEYNKLQDYAEELRKNNPGSSVVLLTDDSSRYVRFKGMYVCFGVLKEGFRSGCRPFIGVDGCRLKGQNAGVLLTAVSVDPNNNLYPLAYAIMKGECGDTWKWFLRHLKQDLNITWPEKITFMSHKQKGLIQAFQSVFPGADHRICLGHLYNNFKNAGFMGAAYKTALFKAALATTECEFKMRMLEMKKLDESAVTWLADKPPGQWSRAYFREDPKCDMLLNNVCETCDSSMLEEREHAVLTNLEWIRCYLMKMLQVNRDVSYTKWEGRLCPRIQKLLEKNSSKVGDCIPVKSNEGHYQISCHDGGQFFVDLEMMTCTCRKWQLTGIPCKHGISAIWHQKRDPIDFVPDVYSVDTYKKVYEPAVIDQNLTETAFITPLPLNFERKRGQPANARREPDVTLMELRKGKINLLWRLKRKQSSVRCRLCGTKGHNAAGCPQSIDDETLSAQPKKSRKRAVMRRAALNGDARTKLANANNSNVVSEAPECARADMGSLDVLAISDAPEDAIKDNRSLYDLREGKATIEDDSILHSGILDDLDSEDKFGFAPLETDLDNDSLDDMLLDDAYGSLTFGSDTESDADVPTGPRLHIRRHVAAAAAQDPNTGGSVPAIQFHESIIVEGPSTLDLTIQTQVSDTETPIQNHEMISAGSSLHLGTSVFSSLETMVMEDTKVSNTKSPSTEHSNDTCQSGRRMTRSLAIASARSSSQNLPLARPETDSCGEIKGETSSYRAPRGALYKNLNAGAFKTQN